MNTNTNQPQPPKLGTACARRLAAYEREVRLARTANRPQAFLNRADALEDYLMGACERHPEWQDQILPIIEARYAW